MSFLTLFPLRREEGRGGGEEFWALQGSEALGSPAVAILLEAPENFWKFIILYKFHIFCSLAALQYFDEKITFDEKVI